MSSFSRALEMLKYCQYGYKQYIKHFFQIKCTQYWPNKNESPTFGPVSIKMIEEKKYAAFIERKLSLNNKAVSLFYDSNFILN